MAVYGIQMQKESSDHGNLIYGIVVHATIVLQIWEFANAIACRKRVCEICGTFYAELNGTFPFGRIM